MDESKPDPQKAASSGWGYLAAVGVFCAPSFLPYGLTALDNLLGSDSLLVLGMACAAISPFAFVPAVLIGLVSLFRPSTSWQIKLAIALLILATLKIQIAFGSRFHY